MTRRAFGIWWRVIPANLAATAFNLLVTFTIPFGLWRGLDSGQFLTVLVIGSAGVWCGAFAYFTWRPIDADT